MTRTDAPWPAPLADTPAVTVIERAVRTGRLSHGLLLAGDDPALLSDAALALADRILNPKDAGRSPYPPDRHPDCIQVRPSGKSRSITADAVRELVSQVNVAPSFSASRVVIVHDADRMNVTASNILLKTLEEPPPGTTLLLLTGRPHSLLPTIRSRVLHFRFHVPGTPVPVEGWAGWLEAYRGWLTRLGQGVAAGKAASDAVLTLYGLTAQFGCLLDRTAAPEFARRKALLPEKAEKEELEALESEIASGLRQRMFASIEEATREHSVGLLRSGDPAGLQNLAAATDSLEHAAGLLRLNLNESAAVEDFLLASLRIWSRR
jgi:DNA polymerase-3 subunit delta'